MKQFEAIIFDMDGVIVDSEPLHKLAFEEVFHEMGYGETHGIDFPAYYGRSDLALWVDFIALHKPSQSLTELTAWKQDRFLAMIRRDRPLFREIPALVEKFAARFALAVASGSDHRVIDAVLALDDLRRFFPTVSSVEDVPRGKPAPDVFLHAAEGLGVSPQACCVIEDSAAGVEAALAAGMSVIAITNSLPAEKLTRATRVVKTYAEIESLLTPE